jgi:hypothetical protein
MLTNAPSEMLILRPGPGDATPAGGNHRVSEPVAG